MIDFHTHILPGMDDGSRSVSESIAMLQLEAQLGMDTVFLTPHYYAEENSPAVFLKRQENALRQLIPHLCRQLPKLYVGAEVQYFDSICAVEDVQYLRIVGTPYLLLEMPFFRWTNHMVNDVLELNDRPDTQVVLAHIDRYMEYQNPEVWQTLRSRGVLMQANVSFFANWKTRQRAISMLKQGEIHMLGSDCHNMESRRPNWDMLPEKAWALAQNSIFEEAFRSAEMKL